MDRCCFEIGSGLGVEQVGGCDLGEGLGDLHRRRVENLRCVAIQIEGP